MNDIAEDQPAAPTGGQVILQSLLDEGVEVLFGYPGGAIMPTYDALYDVRERIRHVLVRHEQGAAHAAQGYARTTGRVGVCLVTSGPGATNLTTALTDALMDSTPLVCICGQVHKAFLGTDAFQEADVVGLTLAATKWSYQITEPGEIPAVLKKAFAVARAGRPGPVLIDVTKNAQIERLPAAAEPPPVTRSDPWRYPRERADLSGIERAAALINQAERPYLLVGQGVLLARAEERMLELAERAGIPIASTLLGLSAVPADHPLYVGMLGMHGNYGANLLTNEADVIVAVGLRFDDRVTGRLDRYARQARIIHVEIDPAEIDKVVPVEVPLIADAAKALDALLPLIEANDHPEWLERFRQCDTEEYRRVIDAQLHPRSGPLTMAEVVKCLSEKTRGEAILVSDVGQHQMIAARYYRFRRPLSHVTSGGLGTMGFALPAAIGACLGTIRSVVAVIGDGGFQMTIQELGTIMQERLPVKIVVLDNGYLGMVRQWQELFFDGRYSFVQLANPDFVTIAAGYGIPGQRVTEREGLDQTVETLLAAEGAYLLHVEVAQEGNVFPMIPAGAGVDQIRLD